VPDPDPRGPRRDPDRDPAEGLSDAERARLAGTLVRRLQWGGAAFLVVLSLGMLPKVLSTWWPALGRAAGLAIWIVAPALVVALLVFAALRLRR
jgi:hypothetical protein